MVIEFLGKNWDTRKTYFAAGHEEGGKWKPFAYAEDLEGAGAVSCRQCRLVRAFFDKEDGHLESLLFQTAGGELYDTVRIGWSPVEFVDTTEKKVQANVRSLKRKTASAGKEENHEKTKQGAKPKTAGNSRKH